MQDSASYTCKNCGATGGDDLFPAAATHRDYRCRRCQRAAHKAWRDRNSEKMKRYEQRVAVRKATTIRGHLSALLQMSRSRSRGTGRGAANNLTLNLLCDLYERQGGCCALSGIEMTLQKGHGKGIVWPYTPSIDRIEAAKGYVVGNVRLVCQWANMMRSRFSDSELLAMCKAIVAQLSLRTTALHGLMDGACGVTVPETATAV